MDEVKDIRDKAEAVRLYAKRAGLGRDMENDAAEIVIRAERRMGELLREMKESGERQSRGNPNQMFPAGTIAPLTAKDLGMTNKAIYQAETLADIPDDRLEQHIAQKRADGGLTITSARNLAREVMHAENPQPFDPQAFNVWSFGDRNPAFGVEYPGNIPGDILQNLLWLYTETDSVIIDPFAGGGVTHDVCAWWSKIMWPVLCASFDAQPCRPEIIQHDITAGFPPSARNASLIFLDPPYWKQKRGDYAGGVNLADLSLDDFHSALLTIIRNGMDRLIPGGHLALLIGATRDGERFDHAAEILYRLHDLKLEERAIVTYSTQQAAPYHITAARKGKLLLNRYRDLMVWRKE